MTGQTKISSDIAFVSIRPGVNVLSVLRHLNYKPWYAIAEFIDNSIQSYISHGDEIRKLGGRDLRLRVEVEFDSRGKSRLIVRDNAGGISEGDYLRAFRPAAVPPDKTGLSEFGIGMKSAACWFAPRWSVRSSALGELVERTVRFDIETIVNDSIEELEVEGRSIDEAAHFTEIVMEDLYQPVYSRTMSKIVQHLSSIYRVFLRNELLVLRVDGEALRYEDPQILEAPYFKQESGPTQIWTKDIDLDFGLGHRVTGFAALRSKGSVSHAGFALFRRSRLVEGSGDQSYRPERIFGKSNSYTYQRLFGELHLEGFEVSHTKDGFKWNDEEDTFVELLKEQLNAEPLPLLSQAEGYRVRLTANELKGGAEGAAASVANAIEGEAPTVIESQLAEDPSDFDVPTGLEPTDLVAERSIEIEVNGDRWRILLELSNDEGVGDWLTYSDRNGHVANQAERCVSIRIACAHPFMQRFSGTSRQSLEPLIRLAAALVLGEITAREGGVWQAGQVRRNVNELLRDALSKP